MFLTVTRTNGLVTQMSRLSAPLAEIPSAGAPRAPGLGSHKIFSKFYLPHVLMHNGKISGTGRTFILGAKISSFVEVLSL